MRQILKQKIVEFSWGLKFISFCLFFIINGIKYFQIRSVLAPPRFGGKECDSLSQTRICPRLSKCNHRSNNNRHRKRPKTVAEMHNLKFGEWSDCTLTEPDVRFCVF